MASAFEQVRLGEALDVATLASRSSSVLEKLRNSARNARADERRDHEAVDDGEADEERGVEDEVVLHRAAVELEVEEGLHG